MVPFWGLIPSGILTRASLGTRDHLPGPALTPGGIWGWPRPTGLTWGTATGWMGGEGSPAPALSQGLGACLFRGRPGWGLLREGWGLSSC
jgi:hypothetical protein